MAASSVLLITIPSLELFMTDRRRRLVLVAMLAVAPLVAACSGSPTGVDDVSTPSAADSTKVRTDHKPWG